MLRRSFLSIIGAGLMVASVVPAKAGDAQTLDVAAFSKRIDHLCNYMGLDPVDAAFAYCVINLKYWADTAATGGYLAIVPEPPRPPLASYTGAYSFFRSPPREERERELAACTGLGLLQGFASECASAMDATLQRFGSAGLD